MDAIILNATTSFASSVPPVRTFNPTGRLRALCFAHSPKKLLFRPQNPRKLDLRCSSAGKFKITCGGVREINESQFSSTVLNSDVPVLVEFVANWCGPCRLISPVIEWVSQEYSDRLMVVKIDHDANPRLIEEYKVYGLPTLILFKSGQEVPESRKEGAITKVKAMQLAYVLLSLDSLPAVSWMLPRASLGRSK